MYDDFEAIFTSFVTATTCVGLVPNLGSPVWYVDNVNHICARIISMGKGKALSNFLAGPRHLQLFLYAGFTLQIKFSTKNPTATYELTVLSDAMHNGVFKVREISPVSATRKESLDTYSNLNEAWKSILGPTSKKLNRGCLIISGLHIDEIYEAMELRPSATVNITQSGQRTLTSFKQFQSKQSSHLLTIPSHLPQQPMTGATFYSLLNITSSIPEPVLCSVFRGTVSEMESERLNQFCNIYGDLSL